MSKTSKIVLAIAAVVIVALLVVACITEGAMGTVTCPDCTAETAAECETCGGEGAVRGTWWALIPPFIAIALALITKEAYSSLFIGIVVGGILSANFSFAGAVDSIINTGLIDAVSGTAGIFVFLVELGIIVALVNKSGGSQAFGNWARAHVKGRVGAQIATFILGILIFIVDYFNCLTVGSVMRPVTDKAKISRAKLAYLIDATAAPICMIAPISSWAAAVSSYAPEGVSGIKMFIQAIPYNFYSLLTFVFVIAILGVTSKVENGAVAGIVIGLSLTLVHILGISFTGTSVNPARSFGPALFVGGDALINVWVFIVAPLIGGALAAIVYKFLASEK